MWINCSRQMTKCDNVIITKCVDCPYLATFYQASPLITPRLHIVERSLTVWKVRGGFISRVRPKISKWVVLYSSATFHANEFNDRSAPCLYSVTCMRHDMRMAEQ